MNEDEPNKPIQAQTLTEATELRYLDPKALRFFRHGAALRLTITDEKSVLSVSVVRLFPLSDPATYLSVRDGDSKEVGILVDPVELDADSRPLVTEDLERRYLVPVVRRIVNVRERFGTLDWQVETDRGNVTFTTRNLRENLVQPAPDRFLLTCVDGNRYDVRDVDALDATSQGFVARHL